MYTKESLGECSDEPTGKDCSVRGESCEDTRGDRWHPEAHQTAQDGLGCAITPRPVWRGGVVNQEAARGLYMPTEPSSALSPDLRLRHRWHRTQHGQEARAYVLAMDSYGIVLQTVTK